MWGFCNNNYHVLEICMSRVINPDSAGKQRNLLSRSIIGALRELMMQPEPNETAHDAAAYIVLALQEISSTVETSVQAWEKRGYWVKADRFRMEWDWAGRLAEQMKQALLVEDWAMIAGLVTQIAGKLSSVKVTPRSRIGTPWVGAWKQFQSSL